MLVSVTKYSLPVWLCRRVLRYCSHIFFIIILNWRKLAEGGVSCKMHTVYGLGESKFATIIVAGGSLGWQAGNCRAYRAKKIMLS